MQIRQKLIFWGTYIASIEFRDHENLGVDTKIREIDASRVELLQRLMRMAAILEICKLAQTLKPDFGKLFFLDIL